MPLAITVRLLTGSYDAAEVDDRDHAEWPPHPARLFCALVAAARGEVDHDALQWLERQPPPVIHAAGQPPESRRAGYVVANRLSDKGGSQQHPGRTNGLRTRVRAHPETDVVTLVWDDAPDQRAVQALDGMARRIPYLGRATGIALVSAEASASSASAEVSAGASSACYEPCDLLQAELSLRTPYPGFLGDLADQYDAGRPAWEVSRYRGYRRRSEPAPAADRASAPSVYRDLLIFQFSGLCPQAHLVARFAEALRSAVLRAAGPEAPAVLHGHGVDGRPHVAFLALPDVGAEHSDGHLLGLAVAVPDLPADERAAVLRAVLGLRREDVNGLVDLAVPGLGRVELLYQPGLVRPFGAAPERWRRGSSTWATATPIVLDRYPKRADDVEAAVRAGLRTVGLPDPIDLLISREPVLAGAARLRPVDLPRQARNRLFLHAQVTFDRRVHGPVLVGAGRYLGVGLLAPLPERGVE